MKESELRQIIKEEVKKFLTEGHDTNIGPLGEKIKSQQDAIKKTEEWIKHDKHYNGDLQYFRGVKWVGNTSEDKLDRLSMKYEDDYILVGLVDGEYWSAYSKRS